MLCLQVNRNQIATIRNAIQIALGELQIVIGLDSPLRFYWICSIHPKIEMSEVQYERYFLLVL